ncbi:stage II sporulation protein D [Tepidibacillus fermentans]|uniref:Stage II sporulation protein D n=1 Tax=Tepidibacillus fermentans TaxID=1281767 RepID=A0A4R3KIJ5_9BACI|nr:stage II sporulation protein D [Tepidibacillus fermentans]TCS83386.1 stage II sporulation protein D [Tepidibacillus fermentans]
MRIRPLIFVFLFVLGAAMIFIPAVFTMIGPKKQIDLPPNKKVELKLDPNHSVKVTVYRNSLGKVETYPLEEYVRGVVAAEMPIEFELEALKAQALSARTYIIKRILEKDFSGVPQGAMVTDTVQHQVFVSDSELQKRWGLEYPAKISKLNQAINETMGQVIAYEGKPISAVYFSTSNGYTENSEDYWSKEVPYLRSVASPWDKASPKYQSTMVVPFSEIKGNLKVDATVLASTGQEWIKILEKTSTGRVKKIRVGDKLLTGREMRDLFSLRSSDFTIEVKKDQVVFHMVGYGHGVGMSQYGANGMAQEGKKAEEIVKYYYKGVQIEDYAKWVK